MVTSSRLASAGCCGECGDDEVPAELKGAGDYRSAETGEVTSAPGPVILILWVLGPEPGSQKRR